MLEIATQALIGLFAGFLGGLLGIGGSIIIIPSLIIYLSYSAEGYSGSKQHLIQASAMICNFFIAAPAVLAHYRAKAIMKPVVYRLVPTAVVGIFIGVAVSNSTTFARQNGKYLGVALAGFLGYVAIYNVWRLFAENHLQREFKEPEHISGWKVICVGLPMGFTAGLLGIGGGALCVPAQQLILGIPLRRAIANSASTIMFTALLGAVYKNSTLIYHQISAIESIKLAALLIPTAIIGSFIGAKLVHRINRKTLRMAFIVFMAILSILVFRKSLTTDSNENQKSESSSNYFRPNKTDNSELPSSRETSANRTTQTGTVTSTCTQADVRLSSYRLNKPPRAMITAAMMVFTVVA